MYDLVTVGDIKLDTFIALPNNLLVVSGVLGLPFGRKIPVEGIVSQIAGTAPNVAIGVAKADKKTAVVSTMGDDSTFDLTKNFLRKHGVDPRYVTSKKGHTSSFAVVLNFQGESTQLVAYASGQHKLPSGLSTTWIHVAELGHSYEQLYDQMVKLKKKTGCQISFNPGSIQLAEKKPSFLTLLQATDILFVNTTEARELVDDQSSEPTELVAKLSALGPQTVIMTDGPNGAYASNDGEHLFAPAFPGKRLEATGAGDAFTSGFLMATLLNKSLAEALSWGSINAASVVGFVGPTAGLLSPKEISRRLQGV